MQGFEVKRTMVAKELWAFKRALNVAAALAGFVARNLEESTSIEDFKVRVTPKETRSDLLRELLAHFENIAIRELERSQ